MMSMDDFVCNHILADVTSMLKEYLILKPELIEHISNCHSKSSSYIQQWFIVDYSLARELRNNNEPILDYWNNYFWGKTSYGLLVKEDPVIGKIYKQHIESKQ